jgi:hypothetical protein
MNHFKRICYAPVILYSNAFGIFYSTGDGTLSVNEFTAAPILKEKC